MKKILYILFCLIPLLAMQSCTEDWAENELTLDGKISTTISVTVPQLPDAHPQTRAMAMKPDMKNLYLAVFDENGYLLEYVKADDDNTQMATENGTTYNYKVSLKPTESTTYIHFIGNAPKTNLDFGSESEVFKNLYTEKGSEAYWQRVTLSNGIKNDSVTITALSGVKLIRNFAWINVISSDTKFVINSYCIVNTRTAGSVAPYNTNKNEFVTFSDYETYDSITANNRDNYNGFIPSVARINSDIPADSTWFLTSPGSSPNNYAYFVYEREKALSNPPFILLKATYDGTANRYYKVDLRDSEGNYFPIVRNFKYRINITSVGHSGYDSAEAAANGAGSGDVSSAIETQSFNNISNGDERLFVSYTDTTLVEKSNNVKLRYKYIVFETAGNGTVTEDNKTSTATVTTTGTVIPEGYNVNNNITAGSGEWNGWREITFSTTDITSANKTQTFIITGTYNGKKLQRTVNITLRNKYTMAIECNPDEIPTDMGKPFDVIVNVPGGLGRSMFPLEIQLEAENQSMTPNLGDNLPTVTGPSIVPEKNKTTIGFIKQVSWSDYEAFFEANTGTSDMPVTCHFKSNKSNTAGTSTTIYASNKYFNQASDNLGYFDAEQFTNLRFSTTNENLPPNSGESFTFTFQMSALPSSVTDSDGKVTVALCNLKLSDSDTNGLTHISSDAAKGIAYYTFTPTNTSVTLYLQNTDVNVEAKVMLSSYHFEDAEKSMNYTKGTFTNLSLTNFNKYLTQNSEGTFTFRLSRQIKQGRYVTVTLGNLVPADNETPLTVIDEKAGTYRFNPTSVAANTNITLQLKVKTSFQTVSAKLSADYFEDNSVTLNPKPGSFSGLELTAGNPTLPVSEPVTLNFTMDDMPSGDVSITLTNLEPEGATRATFENGVYTFSPQNLTEELTFKVVNAGQQVAAKLSAEYFEDAMVSLEPQFTITSGKINLGDKPNTQIQDKTNITFYIYSSNDSTEPIGSFKTTWGNGYNQTNIELDPEECQTIINGSGNIYIKFSVKINGKTYTYTTTADLQTLLKGETVELDW